MRVRAWPAAVAVLLSSVLIPALAIAQDPIRGDTRPPVPPESGEDYDAHGVSAPGYCANWYPGCKNGCGIIQWIKNVSVDRVGDYLHIVAAVRAYPRRPCDVPGLCDPDDGPLYMRIWIDWNADRVWDESERVMNVISYDHIAVSCQDTIFFTTDVYVPSYAVADTTWLRAQVVRSNGEWESDACWRFCHGESAFDRKIWLTRPAIMTVSVTGNETPLEGVEDPVWEIGIKSPHCIPTGPPVVQPMAAGITGGGPTVEFSVGDCILDPEMDLVVTCRYSVPSITGDEKHGENTFYSGSGSFLLDLPRTIQKTSLELSFDIKNQYGDMLRKDQKASIPFYLGYGKALPTAGINGDPPGRTTAVPDTHWLKAAVGWATGRTANSLSLLPDEVQIGIAEDLMKGIYGAPPWRYRDPHTPDLTSNWWELTGMGGSKDGGNCFLVSELWQALMMTLGVSTASVEPYGRQLGFLTRTGKHVSYDPGQHGNAFPVPGPIDAFNRWRFTSHQVGKLQAAGFQPLYFDPTFDNRPARFPEDIIEAYGLNSFGNDAIGNYQQMTSDYRLYQIQSDYEHYPWGRYGYFHGVPEPFAASSANSGERNPAMRPAPVLAGSAVTFGPSFTWTQVDGDGNGLAEQARLTGNVVVGAGADLPARLVVSGPLWSDTTLVAATASATDMVETPAVIDAQVPGAYPFELRWSGGSIADASLGGPFRAELVLADTSGAALDTSAPESPAWSAASFGERPVWITAVADSAIDTDGYGYTNYIGVEVSLHSARAAGVMVQAHAWLPSDSTRFRGATLRVPVPAGDTTVQLRIEGSQIGQTGVDGPYGLSVTLNGGGALGDREEAMTAAYPAADFDAPPFSVYTNESNASGEDFNGDGKYDWLEIALPVDAYGGGAYHTVSTLSAADSSAPAIASCAVDVEFSPETLGLLILRFPGADIRASGVDGPYWVKQVIAYDAEGLLAEDHRFHVTYQPFSHLDFDSVVTAAVQLSSPIESSRQDLQGDGAYDSLRITVPVVPSFTGIVEASAQLAGPNGAVLAAADANAAATSGVPLTLSFAFSGRRLHARGVNGPYELRILRAQPRVGGRLDPNRGILAEHLHTTPSWPATSFQPARRVFGKVIANGGAVAGASVSVDSLADVTVTDASGAWSLEAPGDAGEVAVRLHAVPGLADSAWQVLIAGIAAGPGTRVLVNVDSARAERVDFVQGVPVAVDLRTETPSWRVRAPEPNPVRAGGRVRVEFQAPAGATFRGEVLDVQGRLIQRLHASVAEGTGRLEWNLRARNDRPVPAGLYFVRVHGFDANGRERMGQTMHLVVLH